MTKDEKINIITECYNKCLTSGIVHNKSQFADLTGVNRSTLSAAFNGNEIYLTDSLVGRIKQITEKKENEQMFPSIADTKIRERVAVIPILPIDAIAGSLGDFSQSVTLNDCERMVSPVKDADFAIKVCGESMTPEFPNGSTILIKRINEKAFIPWNNVFVLDTCNGVIIKRVRKTSDENVIECISTNPEFEPFTIDTSFIYGWYRVILVMSFK